MVGGREMYGSTVTFKYPLTALDRSLRGVCVKRSGLMCVRSGLTQGVVDTFTIVSSTVCMVVISHDVVMQSLWHLTVQNLA